MTNLTISLFSLVVLLFSAIIHEISHGLVAYYYGDPTAKNEGRLTLNPLKHLDPFGSVILPISMFLLSSVFGGGFIFGWAKPVPVNVFNLKDPKKNMGIIALFGPVSNIVIAVLFGIIFKLLATTSTFQTLPILPVFLLMIIYINILLAIFNIAPIPPLDGSNILFAILPERLRHIEYLLKNYSLPLLLLFLFFGFRLLVPLVTSICTSIVPECQAFF